MNKKLFILLGVFASHSILNGAALPMAEVKIAQDDAKSMQAVGAQVAASVLASPPPAAAALAVHLSSQQRAASRALEKEEKCARAAQPAAAAVAQAQQLRQLVETADDRLIEACTKLDLAKITSCLCEGADPLAKGRQALYAVLHAHGKFEHLMCRSSNPTPGGRRLTARYSVRPRYGDRDNDWLQFSNAEKQRIYNQYCALNILLAARTQIPWNIWRPLVRPLITERLHDDAPLNSVMAYDFLAVFASYNATGYDALCPSETMENFVNKNFEKRLATEENPAHIPLRLQQLQTKIADGRRAEVRSICAQNKDNFEYNRQLPQALSVALPNIPSVLRPIVQSYVPNKLLPLMPCLDVPRGLGVEEQESKIRDAVIKEEVACALDDLVTAVEKQQDVPAAAANAVSAAQVKRDI
jgi:hypothetical protein